jgi:hypothetical protein
MKRKIGGALISGIFGGMLCSIISGLLNYFVFPFPKSVMDNIMGHSIGGFFCGFFAGFIGVLMHIKFHERNIINS